MQYRTLGRTRIKISEIGFGTWQLGDEWGKVEDSHSIQVVHQAIESGINFFDTALVYGNGASEKVLGTALQGKRDKVVIATKIPVKTYKWPVTSANPLAETFPARWIIECTENSLRNLKTDYIDIQQLHAWTPCYAQQLEWHEALTKLKQEGKIRAFGVSSNDWDPYGPTEAVKMGLLDTVQVIYNIFEQRPSERLLPAALEANTGIIVRVPFEEGLLAGKMGPGYQFTEGDWRAEWLTPDRLQEASTRVEKLKPFLKADTPDLATLALQFCLSHAAVSTVIPGMRTKEQVAGKVQASNGKLLTEQEVKALQSHQFVHGWPYPWSA
jgi:aryl-alcohol dehydrogenase-like predicted oxidoreductase